VPTLFPGEVDNSSPADLAETDEDPYWQQLNRRAEPVPAIVDFIASWFVVRRSTVTRVCDGSSVQREAVVEACRFRLVCESGFMESAEQPVSAAVSSKHPPGPVGTMSSWGEADDEQPGVGITEIRNRTAPVVIIEVRSPFRFGDRLAVLDEARAFPARDRFLVEQLPRRLLFVGPLFLAARFSLRHGFLPVPFYFLHCRVLCLADPTALP
jgi:hypothetical protein